MPHHKPLEGRVALITGASRGLGRAVALAYARAGAHLLLVARTTGALEELDDEIQDLGGSATLIPMDLAQTASIDGLAAPILERWGKLDILVGNAGLLGRITPLTHTPPDLWQKVLDVNVTANWRLLRALDPLLRASDAGRVIFVTSGAGRSLKPYWGIYAVSKAALDAMATVYAREVDETKMRVNLVSPGPLRTGMRAAAMPGEDPMSLRPPEVLADLFVELASPACTRHGEWIDASRIGQA